jgi:cell division septation protein DedD
MEKAKASQLELFSQGRDQVFKDAPRADGFLSRIRNYERFILGLIVFIVSGAIAFCIGVERGKTMSRSESFKRLEVVSRPALPAVKPSVVLKPQNTVPVSQPVVKTEAQAAPIMQASISDNQAKPSESYTVQVATYKNNIAAQKEAQKLRKSGLASLVLVKGQYSIVCIGSFAEKNKAQAELFRLKNKYQYQDCLLRRL